MKRSGYGIIGLGRFGMSLAKLLSEAGEDVIVIDNKEEKLKEIGSYVQEAFLTGKLTRKNMEECGIGQCETVIICMGQKVDISVLAALNALNLGVPRVIAKADSVEHGAVLERIGAEVVYPENETAIRLASVLMGSKVVDMMKLSGDYVIEKIRITEKMRGRKISTLSPERYGVKVVALESEPEETYINIKKETVIGNEDIMVVTGKFSDVSRFEKKELL